MSDDSHEKLYSILLEMKEDLGEMRADIKTTKEQTLKTNGRVTALESASNFTRGKNAVWGLFGGIIASVLIAFINYLFKKL